METITNVRQTVFWKDLSKKEKKHLRDNNCRTFEAFKRTVRVQEEWRKERPEIEPCQECKFIARKLGLI